MTRLIMQKQMEEIRLSNPIPSTVKYIYGYIRRSRQDIHREKKLKQDTLLEQRTLIEGYLQKHYSQINSDIYPELGSGADEIKNRPVFKQILEQLEKVKPRTTAICIKEISRLGRGSAEQQGQIENILFGNQVYIITPYMIYDPLNPTHINMIKFNMFMAHFEYSQITLRMREARYTYASQGKWMTGGGGIPYGYRFDPDQQILIPDEHTAFVVQQIYDDYVNQGLGYHAICTRLINAGIRTATERINWRPTVIRRILLNPVYMGTVQFKTTVTRYGKK